MADAWEQRLAKLEETTLVNSSLMVRLEQNLDRLERKVEHGFTQMQAAQLKTEQSLQTLSAGMNALFGRIDRFIQGLESNGRQN
jgi:hypothetical protein